MLDKSTYIKKGALFSLQSVFFMYNIQLDNGIILDYVIIVYDISI